MSRDADDGEPNGTFGAESELNGTLGTRSEPKGPFSAQSEPKGPFSTAEPSVGQRLIRELTTGNTALTVLSIVLALLIGGILIVASDPNVQHAAGYFFARPMDTVTAVLTSAGDAYAQLFSGSIINFSEYSVGRALLPLADTLTYATPLIAAGLSVALAFRAGLLNIGGQGQLLLGAIFAGYVGFAVDLPPVIHMLAALAAGMVGGAIWGGIAGLIKARSGAHEVIVTIMLNHIAVYLLAFLLSSVAAFRRPGESEPRSRVIDPSAQLWQPLAPNSRVHLGLVFVLVAAGFVWWLLQRSKLGFTFRAVGHNPHAATTAGISVGRSYVYVMLICGALGGLAGAVHLQGTEGYLIADFGGNIGFDAITVALLGRCTPWGTVLAGLLFGALQAGGQQMKVVTQTPIDIVLVVQALIVLFIAAPPLIRAIFRIKVRAGTPIAPEVAG